MANGTSDFAINLIDWAICVNRSWKASEVLEQHRGKVVARSPDRVTGPTEGLPFRALPCPSWHGRETVPQQLMHILAVMNFKCDVDAGGHRSPAPLRRW